MTAAAGPPPPEFLYDAIRKVAVARGVGTDGRTWTLEFYARHDDDSMAVVVKDPSGTARRVQVTEDDFTFGDGTVSLRTTPAINFHMQPLYMKKIHAREHPDP